ncbi:hypothetical protein K0M31_009322 [Melipona bicolor]|uniref:Uncharacterized protein n=1 Tax=Melipona bicolor TaxID=60889 RepID=A0AA40FPB8_9HYME|nr:hypothetical protein K0M31_009322 [Melipona bicolor]
MAVLSLKDNSLLTVPDEKSTARRDSHCRKLTDEKRKRHANVHDERVDDWRFEKGERTFKHTASDCSFLTLMSQLHPAEGVRAHDIARGRATLDARRSTRSATYNVGARGLESRRSAGAAAMQAGRVYRRAVAHAINVQTASMVIPFPYDATEHGRGGGICEEFDTITGPSARKTPVDNGPASSGIDLEPAVSGLASAASINQREKQFKPVQSPIIVTPVQ